MLDCAEIAVRANISIRSVQKRLKNIAPDMVSPRGGRPAKLYNDEILRLFPQLMNENNAIMNKINELAGIAPKVNRSDKQKSRLIPEDLEAKLKKAIYSLYMNNAREDSILYSTMLACQDMWGEIAENLKKDKTLESFVKYFYNKRLMNKSSFFVGYYHAEKWQIQWKKRHDANKYNNALPNNRYDMLSLFKDAGLIGEGFGAGLIWVIDGTQFDTFVKDESGKPCTVSYFAIMDGITKMPLYLGRLESGEKIEDAARILWEAVNLHGVPPWGVVLDNGRAFKSPKIQNLIKSWYTAEDLENMKNNELRKQIFNSTEPCIYPLAKIPRFPMKSRLERSFDELNKHQAERMSISYIGTRDSRAITYDLGSNPITAVDKALPVEAAWNDFIAWIYDSYIFKTNPLLAGSSAIGLPRNKQNIYNSWLYFGGKFENDNLQVSKSLKIPEIAEYYAKFAIAGKAVHVAKAGLGKILITENNITHNLICAELKPELMEQKLSVILDNHYGALIFKEYDEKYYSDLTPNKGDIAFIGKAYDQTFSKVSDLKRKHLTSKIRNNIDNYVDAQIKENLSGNLLNQKNDAVLTPKNTIDIYSSSLGSSDDSILNPNINEAAANSKVEVFDDYESDFEDNILDLL